MRQNNATILILNSVCFDGRKYFSDVWLVQKTANDLLILNKSSVKRIRISGGIYIYIYIWKISLIPLNFYGFCKYLFNVQNLSLKYIKFWFSLTLSIIYRKSFAMSILSLNSKLHHSQNDVVLVLESMVKLVFKKIFYTE